MGRGEGVYSIFKMIRDLDLRCRFSIPCHIYVYNREVELAIETVTCKSLNPVISEGVANLSILSNLPLGRCLNMQNPKKKWRGRVMRPLKVVYIWLLAVLI
jgi:hypothetical protein